MRLQVSTEDKVLIAKYQQHFSARGNYDLLALMECRGISYSNNPIATKRQVGCWAQLGMLKSLLAAGLLKEVP
jgi:hypothetical protein